MRRFSRSDHHGNRVQDKKMKAVLTPSFFSPSERQKSQFKRASSGVNNGQSQMSEFFSLENMTKNSGIEKIKTTLTKFEIFQKSMLENEHINQSLLCRRFSMVKTL